MEGIKIKNNPPSKKFFILELLITVFLWHTLWFWTNYEAIRTCFMYRQLIIYLFFCSDKYGGRASCPPG